jgi:hypothetical protein
VDNDPLYAQIDDFLIEINQIADEKLKNQRKISKCKSLKLMNFESSEDGFTLT